MSKEADKKKEPISKKTEPEKNVKTS